MSTTFCLYTFPLTKLGKLLDERRKNCCEVVKLLFRNSINDKDVLNYFELELKKKLKKQHIKISEFLVILEKITSPLYAYYRKLDSYESWLKSQERKLFLKDRHRLEDLYSKAPYGLAKKLQLMLDKNKDKSKLYVPESILIEEDGKEKEINFEYEFIRGKVKNLRLFFNKKDSELYQNLNEWERKERKWQKEKKWFDKKNKWLERHGLGGTSFKLAMKVAKTVGNDKLQGALFANFIFEGDSPEFFKLLTELKKFEDPIAEQLSKLDEERYRFPSKSKMDLKFEKKKEELVVKRFLLNPFSEDWNSTLVVFDLSKMDKKKLLDQLSGRFSKQTLLILKNMLNYGEDALIYSA